MCCYDSFHISLQLLLIVGLRICCFVFKHQEWQSVTQPWVMAMTHDVVLMQSQIGLLQDNVAWLFANSVIASVGLGDVGKGGDGKGIGKGDGGKGIGKVSAKGDGADEGEGSGKEDDDGKSNGSDCDGKSNGSGKEDDDGKGKGEDE